LKVICQPSGGSKVKPAGLVITSPGAGKKGVASGIGVVPGGISPGIGVVVDMGGIVGCTAGEACAAAVGSRTCGVGVGGLSAAGTQPLSSSTTSSTIPIKRDCLFIRLLLRKKLVHVHCAYERYSELILIYS
jgi:hypothetical protein